MAVFQLLRAFGRRDLKELVAAPSPNSLEQQPAADNINRERPVRWVKRTHSAPIFAGSEVL
jgi:hypothetical protein